MNYQESVQILGLNSSLEFNISKSLETNDFDVYLMHSLTKVWVLGTHKHWSKSAFSFFFPVWHILKDFHAKITKCALFWIIFNKH